MREKNIVSTIEKFAGIEIPLTNTTGKFSFPNNNFLNGKTITGMWIADNPDDDQVAPSGAEVVSNAAIAAANLTMRVNGSDAIVLDVQLSYLKENSGDRQVRNVWIKDYNPGTSYITFQPTPGTTTQRYTVGQSVVLLLRYID